MSEIEKKKRRVKRATKQRRNVKALVRDNFLINLCSKCSDETFSIIAFNTQLSSINLQCNTCNKKTWEKLTHDFDSNDIMELKTLYNKLGHKRKANINISSNAHNIVKINKTQDRRISQEIQDRVWNRDGGACVQCSSNENLEFDHIIPVSKGGANTYRNIQLLCEPCNRSKSDKIG